VGIFRASLYLRRIFLGSLLCKEKFSKKLPMEITKHFELGRHKRARFIIYSPYISLLSFKGQMILKNSKNEILGKLLINEEKESASGVPTRIIEVRQKQAGWISSEFIDLPQIDQIDSLATINLALDWRTNNSKAQRQNKEIQFEFIVKVSEK
jgi:hypothetical protein